MDISMTNISGYNTNNEYCIYKYTNKLNEVMYIGQTNNFRKRNYIHKNKIWYTFATKYEVAKVNSATLMGMYELYYINILKPKYNKKNIYDEDILLFNNILPELVFDDYSAHIIPCENSKGLQYEHEIISYYQNITDAYNNEIEQAVQCLVF